MIKIKISKKQIKEATFKHELLKVGYCELEYLLMYKQAFAYSGGQYGWACDYYNIENRVIISTGYAPAGEEVPPEICRKYNDEAKKIINEGRTGTPTALDKLLIRFRIEAQDYLEETKK